VKIFNDSFGVEDSSDQHVLGGFVHVDGELHDQYQIEQNMRK